jgi:hypothetical protein
MWSSILAVVSTEKDMQVEMYFGVCSVLPKIRRKVTWLNILVETDFSAATHSIPRAYRFSADGALTHRLRAHRLTQDAHGHPILGLRLSGRSPLHARRCVRATAGEWHPVVDHVAGPAVPVAGLALKVPLRLLAPLEPAVPIARPWRRRRMRPGRSRCVSSRHVGSGDAVMRCGVAPLVVRTRARVMLRVAVRRVPVRAGATPTVGG